MSSTKPGLAGIHPILYAFFGADGTLDRTLMARQTRACLNGGAHGIAVLGLATEVAKLSVAERRQVVEWAAEDIGGHVPLAVTIAGATPEMQIEAVRHAAAFGAAWVILQPPPDRTMAEADLLRFFGTVMDASPLPVAIQNAPDYLGIGLSPEAIATMARNHANFVLLKGEGPATLIARTIEQTGGKLAVFNGRGGLELPDNLRAGCAGMIPAPDCFDVQVRIYEAMRNGDEATAERLYAEILPAIVFVMQSIDHLICYGKRLVAARLGVAQVFDREPALAPTPFGLAALARFAAHLPPFNLPPFKV